MIERIDYRPPRGEWFYLLQTLALLLLSLGLGALLFFGTFWVLLMLGAETEISGTVSLWTGAGGWIFMCFFLGDRVGKAQWVFLTCEDGRIFLLGPDAMLRTEATVVPVLHMGRRARRQFAWAEKLTMVPGTAAEILKVCSLHRTLWGFRARCVVRDGFRVKKRTLRISGKFLHYDLLLQAFRKLSGVRVEEGSFCSAE